MSLETKKLGLAAYIKMKGGKLVSYTQEGVFAFEIEGDSSLADWEMAYMNSCCHRHDTELMNLKKLLRW